MGRSTAAHSHFPVSFIPYLRSQAFFPASPNPYYAKNHSETAQIFTDTISAMWVDENADIQAMLDEAQEKMLETVNKE